MKQFQNFETQFKLFFSKAAKITNFRENILLITFLIDIPINADFSNTKLQISMKRIEKFAFVIFIYFVSVCWHYVLYKIYKTSIPLIINGLDTRVSHENFSFRIDAWFYPKSLSANLMFRVNPNLTYLRVSPKMSKTLVERTNGISFHEQIII